MRCLEAFKAAAGVGILMVAITAGPALAEQGTVIVSSAPSYPVGTSLADGETLSLSDGSAISILTISARMIELSGPFEGLIPAQGDGSESDLLGNLSDAVFQSDEGSPELGGVRPLVINAPEIVIPKAVVDADHGGGACVSEGNPIGLHRNIPADTSGDWTYGDLRSERTGETAQVRWESLQYTVDWPSEMTFEDGEQFTLQMADSTEPVRFGVYMMPETEDFAERINWMAQRGCSTQIEGMVAQWQGS